MTVKEAFDSQITEFTSDMKILIEDAKEKIDAHIKASEEKMIQITTTNPTLPISQTKLPTNSYASVLINPPAHANPRVAAREGIKARQFAIEGIKNSKFSHLDSVQLKTELNKLLTDIGIPEGKLHSVMNTRSGSTIIEMDNDTAARWLSRREIQRELCDAIGSNTEFRIRTYNVMAFNIPLAINTEDENHHTEISKANNYEIGTITMAKLAKPIDRRSQNQRTAHLLISFNNANAANRSIVNGLTICNRRCHVEKTKKELVRCLKCQGWNHIAREWMEKHDKCGNCSETHRTSSCLTNERRCISCGTNDHASWSRTCPTFLNKADEFNKRNPNNSMQFFPTADPWTWTTTDKTHPTTAPIPKSKPTPQNRTSNIKAGKNHNRQEDKWTPTYQTTHTYKDTTPHSLWPPNLPRQQNTRGANNDNSSTQMDRPTNSILAHNNA